MEVFSNPLPILMIRKVVVADLGNYSQIYILPKIFVGLKPMTVFRFLIQVCYYHNVFDWCIASLRSWSLAGHSILNYFILASDDT